MIIHLCASQAESKAIVVLFKLNSYHLTQMICVLMIVRANDKIGGNIYYLKDFTINRYWS